MFGRMRVEPVVQFDAGVDLPAAVAALMKVTLHVNSTQLQKSHGRRRPFSGGVEKHLQRLNRSQVAA